MLRSHCAGFDWLRAGERLATVGGVVLCMILGANACGLPMAKRAQAEEPPAVMTAKQDPAAIQPVDESGTRRKSTN